MADIAVGMESGSGIDLARSREAARRANSFAAASRHSARVRFLRVALLGGAVGVVAILLVVALFDPFNHLGGSLSIAGIGVDGTRVTMDHPKLAGFRKDGRPYLINAQKAIQDVTRPKLVELHGIDADIATADKGMAHMSAKSGFYDSEKERMDVSDEVHVKSSQYDVWLKSASVEFKTGRYYSNEPVTIVTSTGTTMAGDTISATDNGKELVIEGHVKTTVQPASSTDDTAAQLKGPNP